LTVATKQPAMTASLFARTLIAVRRPAPSRGCSTTSPARSGAAQSAAILGNMLLAFATAAVLRPRPRCGGARRGRCRQSRRSCSPSIDPFASAALFYAAVAGVGLFLAGIVSGYYDNYCVYHRVPERLQRLVLPTRLLGVARWQRTIEYLRHHLGGIAGNLFFGFYLGLSSSFGQLAGLPFDIRHIAFSAANFGYAWQAFDWQLALPVVLVSVAGVVLIGLVNLTVSFSLAFYLALRATRTSRRDSGHMLLRGLVRHPQGAIAAGAA
jgi:site-specific recombinase